MEKRREYRVRLSPAMGVAVLSLCGSAMAACWDIWVSNQYAEALEVGSPCFFCYEDAFTGIRPGTACSQPLQLTEDCADVLCYHGVLVQDQYGLTCDPNFSSPVMERYCPIICQSPCLQPKPR